MNELFTGMQTRASDVSHYIRSLVESGDKIFRQGHDLVRLTPAGDVIRVEGFFDLADQLTSENVELDATLSWLLAQSQFPAGQKVLAQANSAAVTDAADDALVLSNDKLIAKVAEVVGSVAVIRNGTVVQLTTGDGIYLGDVVTTQTNSKLKIIFASPDTNAPSTGSAEIADMTRVMVSGQLIATETGKYLQANLKVDTGNVSVANVSADVRVLVDTPAGQVTVPPAGLNVSVQGDTAQTKISLPTGAQAAVPVVYANGQTGQISVGQEATVIAPQQTNVAAQAVPQSTSAGTQPAAGTTAAQAATTAQVTQQAADLQTL